MEPMQMYKLKDPVTFVEQNTPLDTMSYIINAFTAKVVDMADQAVVDAVVEHAKEEGFAELYLLDKEFVTSALLHEMERRKNGDD